MAQLRDTKTSEILYEGTPLEVALIADEIGRDEVLFDDVGESFDPDVVTRAFTGSISALESAVDDKKIPKDQRDSARDSLKREKARSEEAKNKVTSVKKELERVRAR